jgi:hypothetical protein
LKGRNTEEKWRRTEKSVKEAALETIGEKRKVWDEGWFDEDCRAATAEKNRVTQRMLQHAGKSPQCR